MRISMNREQAFKVLAVSSAAIALQGCVAAVVPLAAGGLMTQRDTTPDAEQTEAIDVADVSAPAAPASAPARAPEVQAAIDENVEALAVANDESVQEPPVTEPAQTVTEAAQSETVTAANIPQAQDAAGSTAMAADAPVADIPEPEAETEPVPVLVASLPEEEASEPVPVLVASLPETAEAEETPAPIVIDRAEADAAPEADVAGSDEAIARLAVRDPALATVTSAAAVAEAVPEPRPAGAPIQNSRPAVAASPSPVVATLFDPLVNYATAPEFESGREGRSSAMLRDPTSLRPTRAACAGDVPTVLIDLDPDGEDLALSESLSAPSALGVKLAQMRAQGIAIAWISRESRESEATIRAALTRSGLDLSGGDQLLLMGSPDDRKQTLRDGLAGTSCLVAIAGDTRSDFHELFDYLLNPDDAYSLQPMIGDGWFIIPTPLLPERP